MKLKPKLHQCQYGCVEAHKKAQPGLATVWINPLPMKKTYTVEGEALPKQARFFRKEKTPVLRRGKAKPTAWLKARFIYKHGCSPLSKFQLTSIPNSPRKI